MWTVPRSYLEDLIHPVILGSDFLQNTGLLIDLCEGRGFFRLHSDNKLPLIGRTPPPDSPSVCTSMQTCPDLSHLVQSSLSSVLEVIDEFPDVLTSRLGLTTLLEYDIELLDNVPVKISPYRLIPPKMEALRKHVHHMLEQGIIRPSVSPYSSPIFLVPKGCDDFRAVVDYRALNKKIKVESVPLPDVHSCFHWFKSATVFTTLDFGVPSDRFNRKI
jgi:hypothetical protein